MTHIEKKGFDASAKEIFQDFDSEIKKNEGIRLTKLQVAEYAGCEIGKVKSIGDRHWDVDSFLIHDMDILKEKAKKVRDRELLKLISKQSEGFRREYEAYEDGTDIMISHSQGFSIKLQKTTPRRDRIKLIDILNKDKSDIIVTYLVENRKSEKKREAIFGKGIAKDIQKAVQI